MRLTITKSKNKTFYYAVDAHREGKKVVSNVAKVIGEHSKMLADGIEDPKAYAEEQIRQLNELKKENKLVVSETYDFSKPLTATDVASASTAKNIGWLYIHKLYKALGIPEFTKGIPTKAKYDLNAIIEYLVVNRFLFPGSKRSAFLSKDNLYNGPKYSLHDSYRALDIWDLYDDELQKILFEGTKNIIDLNTDILYYDCTNFYFETEEEDDDLYDIDGDIIQWGLRKYGKGKDKKACPLVQMGLFTDKNGIPISYCVHHGSNNEQNTVIPLESRMIQDYSTSKFIYCSDAGLGSADNRFYNTLNNRDYVVTQSLKEIKQDEQKLIFEDMNWMYVQDDKKVSLKKFKEILDKIYDGKEITDEEKAYVSHDMIYKKYPMKRSVPLNFLKNMKVKGNVEIEEKVFVTFSAKYYFYQKDLFNKQLKMANEWISGNSKRSTYGPNDIRRFIQTTNVTKEGEVADKKEYTLNNDTIEHECKYHGFYGVATSLDRTVQEILDINASRWRIEQSFRILKSDFDTRPMYVSTQTHIRAHIAICYMALLLYRILERKLNALQDSDHQFTTPQILSTLKNMNVVTINNPAIWKSIYTGSNVLNALEETFHLSLDKAYYKDKVLKQLLK